MKYLLITATILLILVSFSSENKKMTCKRDEQRDSVIYIEKYKTGDLKYVIYSKDSLEYKELHIEYFKNGQIKEIGHQGHWGPWGVPVGTWLTYDSLGILHEKRVYNFTDTGNFVIITKLNDKREITISYDPDYGELDTLKIIDLLQKK